MIHRWGAFWSGVAVLAAAPVALAQGHRRYEIKAGSVETTNSMLKGSTSTLYFDDFGEKNATVTKVHTVVMGTAVDTQSWTINADGYVIRYDAVKKTGTRSKRLGHAAVGPVGGIDAEKLAASAQASTRNLPAKAVAGKSCPGTEITALGMTVRTWTWKGLPLYTETYLAGPDKPPIVVEAINVDETPPPPSVFAPPSDVKITDR